MINESSLESRSPNPNPNNNNNGGGFGVGVPHSQLPAPAICEIQTPQFAGHRNQEQEHPLQPQLQQHRQYEQLEQKPFKYFASETEAPTSASALAPGTETTSTSDLVPKHLRVRYWSSWEELYLVELWRYHLSEINLVDKNYPVFRCIMEKMRAHGFNINAQECRRKIGTLRNKYFNERRRLELDKTAECEWLLYPLIHCMYKPRQTQPDLDHQHHMIDRLMGKIAQLKPEEAWTERAYGQRQHFEAPHADAIGLQKPRLTLRPPRYRHKGLDRFSLSTKHGFFTWARLEQLREDNRLLAAQRDSSLRRLQCDVQEYSFLQTFFKQWKQQQEHFLQQLEVAELKA